MTNAEALARFVTEAQAMIAEQFAVRYPRNPVPTLEVVMGRRYAKVTQRHGSGRQVYCFVDMTNGDILKAKSWKAPAKDARGNVHTYGKVSDCVTMFGVHYVR